MQLKSILTVFFMNKFFVVVILSCFSLSLLGQKNTDLGVFVGTSSYLGDINPTIPFYSPSLSYGGLLKYNYNAHHATRFGLTQGKFRGDDLDFYNSYQQLRAASFSASLIDISVAHEFSFFPFENKRNKKALSTYVFGGIGYTFVLASEYEMTNHLVIPFGLGGKYNLTDRWGMGLEWSLRKTFKDGIDGVTDNGDDFYQPWLHNKDWYSYAGVYFLFRLFDNKGDCPVYW
jgi:hypothetical protein